jgi:hypothetical protein
MPNKHAIWTVGDTSTPLAPDRLLSEQKLEDMIVAAILDEDRDTRPYLKSLRKAVEASSIGTREQGYALLEGL